MSKFWCFKSNTSILPYKTSAMKSFLPLVALLVFASCTTAYKSGQTPDDVYYSPERPKSEYVQSEKRESRNYRGTNGYYSYEEDRYEEDRYYRMKIRNRSRWSYLDDYYRDPYAYRYYNNSYYGNGYWNSHSYWNYYFNPYATNMVAVNPRSQVYNKPRTYNLHVFDDPKNNSYNPKVPGSRARQYNTQGDYNSNRNYGGNLRSVFGTNDSYSPNRSSTPSSSASNSGSSNNSNNSNSGSKSSNSGSNAPVRRF
jgi:hypothetical protein